MKLNRILLLFILLFSFAIPILADTPDPVLQDDDITEPVEEPGDGVEAATEDIVVPVEDDTPDEIVVPEDPADETTALPVDYQFLAISAVILVGIVIIGLIGLAWRALTMLGNSFPPAFKEEFRLVLQTAAGNAVTFVEGKLDDLKEYSAGTDNPIDDWLSGGLEMALPHVLKLLETNEVPEETQMKILEAARTPVPKK